jgi:ATPase subunit of ABC transporter with duplicated ATPase domains
MEAKSFHLTLPNSLSNPSASSRVESKRAIVIIGANGSGKTRLGTWIEFSSEHRDVVHRISAQKSLTIPPSTSTSSLDVAQAKLFYGHATAGFEHKSGQR